MAKAKIINLLLFVSSFFLLLSLLKLIIFYGINRNSIFVEGQGAPSCSYLKWDDLPSEGIIPKSVANSSTVVKSIIKEKLGRTVEIEGSLNVINTTTVSNLCLNGVCYSNWPVGGSGYWLLNSNANPNFIYPSSSLWKVVIGTTSPSGSLTTLNVFGNVKADSFVGAINANYVSAGMFGSSTAGGIFSFPSYLSIGTTTIVKNDSSGLNVVGTVQTNRLCIGGADGACYNNWPSLYSITTRFPFYNGLLYPPTTSWPSVYPVTSRDFIKGRNLSPYQFPYLSFKDVITNLLSSPNDTATITEWFDIAYGYHNVNEPNYEKALYVEGSDNSMPVKIYQRELTVTTTGRRTRLTRDNPNDIFLGATYYDRDGVLRSTRSEKFLVLNCFNDNPNDGCTSVGPSLGNFLADPSTNATGRVILELRVTSWQRPSSTYACSDRVYFPSIRLQSWSLPNDVFFKIGKYRLVTSTGDSCDTAALRSKVQARFLVEPIKYLSWNGYPESSEVETTTPQYSLVEIKNFLTSNQNYAFRIGDFIYVFKEIGISLLSVVSK